MNVPVQRLKDAARPAHAASPALSVIETASPQTAAPASVEEGAPARSAQDWVRVLARYREPDPARSAFEVAVSVGPFIVIWGLALWALQISHLLAFALGVVNAVFVLRLFLIQHDCGHGAFFANKRVSDWVGRALGVFTMTPYDVWRRTHSAHHASTGNLDKRGFGDVHTMTVAE